MALATNYPCPMNLKTTLLGLLASGLLAGSLPANDSTTPPPPKPLVADTLGRLHLGERVPNLELVDMGGRIVHLQGLLHGKPLVVGFLSLLGGRAEEQLTLWEYWHKRHSAEVDFVGIALYSDLPAVQSWASAHADLLGFPLLSDNVGRPPAPTKTTAEMSAQEKESHQAVAWAYHYRTALPRLTGIYVAVPTTLALDAKGSFAGASSGPESDSPGAMAGLLRRLGMKPTDAELADAPTKAAKPKPIPATTSAKARPGMLAVGAMAPDFTAQDAEGHEVKLSDYRGKVVVLDFWATWCGPCMRAMPHTQETAARYRDQGVVVLANCTNDARAKFETWVKANHGKYPDIIWTHDPLERSPERVSQKLYGVSGIPTQFILDPEGRVVDTVVGYLQGEVMLDDALRKAGIQVADGIEAKAAQDRLNRSKPRGN